MKGLRLAPAAQNKKCELMGKTLRKIGTPLTLPAPAAPPHKMNERRAAIRQPIEQTSGGCLAALWLDHDVYRRKKASKIKRRRSSWHLAARRTAARNH